jgi:hypothetical protein
MRVLYTSVAIRREIARIFRRTRQRRVALVAYVGKGATAQLPNPKGLHVYCWPQPGGTSATAVEGLRRRKATVFFADRLHMKVYWSERDGAVVCSANLSDNALGSGNLREAGIALPSSQVDIDRLIALAGAKPADDASIEQLRKREALWNRAHAARGKAASPTFPEWYDGTGGVRWKLDYYDSFGGQLSRRAKRAVKAINPAFFPQNLLYCRRGSFDEEDWVLRCRLTNTGRLLAREWVYVECVVLVAKSDRAYNAEYPFQAVQARELKHCPAPPFQIDRDFKTALREVSIAAGYDKAMQQAEARVPTASFLKKLRDHWST